MTGINPNISCEAEGNFAPDVLREEPKMLTFIRYGAYVLAFVTQALCAYILWNVAPERPIPEAFEVLPYFIQRAYALNDKNIFPLLMATSVFCIIAAERMRK